MSDNAPALELDITFAQLKEIVETRPDTYRLIDVRQPWEIEERGRLPRAVNLPLQEIEQAMSMAPEEFKQKYGFDKVCCSEADVIVYCCRGYRATEAKKKLRDLGVPCVKVFHGFVEYREQGGLIDRSTEEQSSQG